MAPSSLHLEQSVLEWALETACASHAHPHAIELLESWLEGESVPTLTDIHQVSSLTGIRETDLLRSSPPVLDCELIHDRTCITPETETASRNLADTHQHHLRILAFCHEHMPKSFFSLLPFENLRQKSAQEAADLIRSRFSLPVDFVTEWKDPVYALGRARKAISAKGILIHLHSGQCADYPYLLPLSECRSYSCFSEEVPFLFVNTNDTCRGQLYALLFSLVQLLLGRTRLFNDALSRENLQDEDDRFCEDVTEALLMPTHLFADSWKSIQCSFAKKMEMLEDRYMIAPYAFLRRAVALGELRPGQFETMKNMTVSTWMPEREYSIIRADIWSDLILVPWDIRFLLALNDRVQQGVFPEAAAHELTCTARVSYARMMEKAQRIAQFDPDTPKMQKHGSTLEILGPICIISRKPDERKNRV